jgi:hypothetical protein
VLDLSEESHGNAIGIGLADVTVQRVVDKIDRNATYLNCITAQTPEKARLPMWFSHDREAVAAALLSIGSVRPEEARIVHIKDTEEVKYAEISESLLPEARVRTDLKVLGEPAPMAFNDQGDLERLRWGSR